MAYSAANAVHLTDSAYRDDDGYWYGIRRSVLGFIVDSSMLRRMEIDAPADWADLLELPYQELIWTSNYAADGAGRAAAPRRHAAAEGLRRAGLSGVAG